MGEAFNILNNFCDKYDSVIKSSNSEQENFQRNSKLLLSIIEEVENQANLYADKCRKEIESNNNMQIQLLDERAALYSEKDADQKQLSALEAELLRITAEIKSCEDEITQNQAEIVELQNKVRKKKKKRKKWKRAWWATCWIPGANIGTGTKFIIEDGEYSALVKQKQRDIDNCRERINYLNSRIRDIKATKLAKKESSSELSNKITALAGKISLITERINVLRVEMLICSRLLEICNEVSIKIFYAKDMNDILDEYEDLKEIRRGLVPEESTKYIAGCICHGDKLSLGQKLNQNEYLLSENRRFAAVMQSDNDFAVYNSSGLIWSSGTKGTQGNGYIEIDRNGLVLLNGTNGAWNAKRSGAYMLVMQNDGNLVVYTKDNDTIWATDTYTYANVPGICFEKIDK